jgi:hypothetical protein
MPETEQDDFCVEEMMQEEKISPNQHKIHLTIMVDGAVDEDLDIDLITYMKISRLLPEDDPV